MTEHWTFEVVQDGMVVATGDAPNLDSAISEAVHYVRVYGQDGPCRALVKRACGEQAGDTK